MDLAGIDVRPLRTMEGTTEFCEVFFDEVRVPVANRVGAENDGWRVAMVTLSFERGTAFVSEMLQTMELVRDLAELAKTLTRHGAAGVGRRRPPPRHRPHRRRARRAVGAHQAQHLPGPAHRPRRAPAATCSSSPTPSSASASASSPCTCSTGRRCRSTTLGDAARRSRHVQRPHPRPVAGDRRRHLAGAAQHRRRARARCLPRRTRRRSLMDFELTDDQVALQDGIRSFLAGPVPAREPSARSRRPAARSTAAAGPSSPSIGVFSPPRRRLRRCARRCSCSRSSGARSSPARWWRRTSPRGLVDGAGRTAPRSSASSSRVRAGQRGRAPRVARRRCSCSPPTAIAGVDAATRRRSTPSTARSTRSRPVGDRRPALPAGEHDRRCATTPTRWRHRRAWCSPPRCSSACALAADRARQRATPRSASSSAGRSASSRRSSTSSPTCCAQAEVARAAVYAAGVTPSTAASDDDAGRARATSPR